MTAGAGVPPGQQQAGFEAWAVIELFGHQRIAGRVTEQQIGGTNMVRVDVPEVEGHPAFTRFYGAGAIYSITPSSEEIVRLAVRSIRPEPLNVYIPELRQLPASTGTEFVAMGFDGTGGMEDDDDAF